ncbi:MAG: hypothetical protein WAS05_03790 [Candidatus Nanopelagicales bacterium]
MFFFNFLAAVVAEEHLPGGAGVDDSVPHNIAEYTTPYGYGIFALVVLLALLFFTTRFKVTR